MNYFIGLKGCRECNDLLMTAAGENFLKYCQPNSECRERVIRGVRGKRFTEGHDGL